MKRSFSRVKAGVLVAAALGLGSATAYAFLAGSNFEDSDGNLDPDGGIDWVNAPAFEYKTDLVKSTSDDSLGQGTKEDDPVPTVTSGSIPPNKSDLMRFYFNSGQTTAGHILVELAWIRSNVLGNANMDFELNQSKTDSSNGVTPVRTAGDVLLTFDFTNGGANPVLGLLTWITTGADSQCYASGSKVPCWGNRKDLSGLNEAEGAVNTVDVPDNTVPGGGATLPALTFGEAGVDLTAAGVIPSGACFPFASVYLKSRSSSSFTSEIKDFIAPLTIDAAVCGDVTVNKVDDNGNAVAGVLFTLGYPDGGHDGFCTTNDAGTCTITNVANGTYEVFETVPTGYAAPDGGDLGPITLPLPDGGATATINVTDPRLFKVYTIICRETDNTLYSGNVSYYDSADLTPADGGVTKQTLKASDLDAGAGDPTESQLCNLFKGAVFSDKQAGNHSSTIQIPATPNP